MLVGLQHGNTTNYGAAAAATLTGAAGVQDIFTALVPEILPSFGATAMCTCVFHSDKHIRHTYKLFVCVLYNRP